ncbi:Calcium-transporting ATPase [Bertholletia excelsa]
MAAALQSNLDAGISGDAGDLLLRHEAFGSNVNNDDDDRRDPSLTAKCFHQLLLKAFKDITVILLLCCASLSLLIGIMRSGPKEGFLDGAIITARRRKFSSNRKLVAVIRNGKEQHVAASEVVVGDVIYLNAGDRVPVDGLLIDGIDLVKLDDGGSDRRNHPSLFAGTAVLSGCCRMLVAAVGKSTEKSRLMRSLTRQQYAQESRLESCIDETNSRLCKIYVSLSLLVLTVHMLRCFICRSWCQRARNPDPKDVKKSVEEIMNEVTKLVKKQGLRVNGLVAMLCVLLFSLRDALPVGVLLSLACAAKKMENHHHAEVRKLPACATAGLITAIITGDTADLTLKHSDVADLWVGLEKIKSKIYETNSKSDLIVLDNLQEGIGLNGSEHWLLLWAEKVIGVDVDELRRTRTVVQTEDFDKKRSGLLLKRNGEGGETEHVHWRGDPDKVLSMCSHYNEADGTRKTLDADKRTILREIIERLAIDSPQCVAFAHKEIMIEEREGVNSKLPEQGFTLLGIVSLKNPYEAELRQAVKQCQDAGVDIKLVVASDINTARFMALNAGILRPHDGKVIEASEFRHSSSQDRMKMLTKIKVMANSTPSDKLLLLQCLKQEGEVVAITGTSSRDSPALKEADMGLSLGHAATESSEFIILDQKFVTIAAMVKLGRSICDNLLQFVQLQLTPNVAAFMTNFIVALSYNEEAIRSLELLWVNLIMDILGALALAESQYSQSHSNIQLEENPQIKIAAKYIKKPAWGYIIIQSLYQVAVLLTLFFWGCDLLNTDQRVLGAMIFNCFALCQVFVLISVASVGMVKNIKSLFLVAAIVVLQIALMEIMVVAVEGERLDLRHWCISASALGFQNCVSLAYYPVDQSLRKGFVTALISIKSLHKNGK